MSKKKSPSKPAPMVLRDGYHKGRGPAVTAYGNDDRKMPPVVTLEWDGRTISTFSVRDTKRLYSWLAKVLDPELTKARGGL